MKRVFVCAALLLSACASAPEPSGPVLRHTPRADGTQIEWLMEGRTSARKQGVLLLSQGTGCQPAAANPNLGRWHAIAPDFVAVRVEKYGVSASDPSLKDAPVGEVNNCPAAYVEKYRLYGRVVDFEAVVADLRKEPWWSGELILMGGSEGGGVMSALAPRLPETDAVIFQSSANGWPLARMISESVPPQARTQIERVFAQFRADPQAKGSFSGLSAQYYLEFMDKPLAEDMLKSDAPALLIFGERDQSAPVQAARDTKAMFDKAGKTNLTYWEKAGLDHSMTDAAGVNHINEVIADATVWVKGALKR